MLKSQLSIMQGRTTTKS